MVALIANIVLVLAAMILPRLVVSRDEGLAGAATAALIVLGGLGLSLIIGIVAAVAAWRKSKKAGTPITLLGFAPLGVFVLGLAALFVLAQINLG